MTSDLKKKLEEVCRSLIYHGRHFRSHSDAIVIRKAVEYINEVTLAEFYDTHDTSSIIDDAETIHLEIKKKNLSSSD